MVFHALKIKDIRRETADCMSLAFDVPDVLRADFRFREGQYLTLKTELGGVEVRRSYSICSSPFDNELRVAIKKVPDGIFSTFANDVLKKGDSLEVAAPDGRFYVKNEEKTAKIALNTEGVLLPNHYVLIAAGSGITPILSILKTVLQRESDCRVTLIYGNKNAASVIFREEIEGLKNKYVARLQVFHVLSRERMDADLLRGRIDSAKMTLFLDKILSLPSGGASNEILQTQFFICGPEEMINDVRTVLEAQGFDKKRIHFELFGTNRKAKTVREEADKIIAKASILLDSVSFEVPMREGEAVLDAALRVGADLPFACKGGVCCTCRAKLTEGVVEMAVNYALDHEEVEAGFILTCQAIPKTNTLTVNFDLK